MSQNSPVRNKGIEFDPTEYQLQKRYRPMNGDVSFDKKFGNRLFIGMSAGYKVVNNCDEHSSGMPLHIFMGYGFSPLHSLRGQFHYQRNTNQNSVTIGSYAGFSLEYMMNFTNFMYGYNKNRRLSVIGILGAGLQSYRPKTNLPKTCIPFAQLGIQFAMRVNSGLHLTVEPYAGMEQNASSIFDTDTPSNLNTCYGVDIGLSYFFAQGYNDAEFHNSVQRRLFLDFAQGFVIPFGTQQNILRTYGSNSQLYIGKWVSPILGFRVGITTQQYYWEGNKKNATYDSFSKQQIHTSYMGYSRAIMNAGRMEAMINLLNLHGSSQEPSKEKRYGLDLSMGVDYGWEKKTSINLSTHYFGLTTALQMHYWLNEGTSVFMEPRFLMANYTIPYGNVKGHASYTDQFAQINVGTRIHTDRNLTLSERMDETPFLPHWFAGLSIGGLKCPQSIKYCTGSENLSTATSGYIGYTFSPRSSLRLAMAYERIENKEITSYQVDISQKLTRIYHGLWHNKLNIMNLRLFYMVDMVTLCQPDKTCHPMNVFLEIGPTYSVFLKDGGGLCKGEMVGGVNPCIPSEAFRKSSGGVALGIVASRNLTKAWSIDLELLEQFDFSTSHNMPKRKMGLSVGANYHLGH